jgi:hypothetical protein
VLEVSAEQIRDFQLCRFLYKSRHIEKLQEKKLPARDQLVYEFEDAVSRVISYFYFETMANQVPSFNILMYKWRHTFLNGLTAEDIARGQDDPERNRNYFTTEGMKILSAFHERNHKNPGRVIMLYSIPLSDGIIASGIINLVIEKDGKVLMPHYTTKTMSHFQKGTIGSNKAILDTIAYRYKTNKIEDYIQFSLLKKIKDEKNVVTDLDIRQIKELADEMSVAKLFPASVGCYWCSSCQFSSQCSAW